MSIEKSKEELNALKNEVETLSRKLAELTDEEFAQVTGGVIPDCYTDYDVVSSPDEYEMT